VRVLELHDEHVAHPLQELQEGPPWPEHLPVLHASPSALNAEVHASNGPRQPCTFTLLPLPVESMGASCPERHRLSDRTHASSARKGAAFARPALVFSSAGGGVHPSSSTHWETVLMLVSASTHSSLMASDVPPSPTRYPHSSASLAKSDSSTLESHPPPERHASQRAVTSATHAASVG
jgi:hypothetical protein